VALILSIVWFIFNPIWFPQANLKYDYGRIFLLLLAVFAAIIAFNKYKKNINR